VTARATAHAVIHPEFALPPHFSLTFGDRLYTPGDSFALPPRPVDVLLTPLGAPWMKLSEAIDFVRKVRPPRAVPFHDGGLGAAHHALHTTLLKRFAPDTTLVQDLAIGGVLEF
jgi:L-ascorbate metabolism protein UlaG (beta-lactamase superfamily)